MRGRRNNQAGLKPVAQVEMSLRVENNPRKFTIGIVSTYPPRRCGIATFTKDLYDSLSIASEDCRVIIAAMERDDDDTSYGEEVVARINQDKPAEYRRAARIFAEQHVDVVIIEHEFGIYGQKNKGAMEVTGEYVLELAKALTELGIPYVPTLHTVLAEPGRGQRTVLRALCDNAAKVTVFTETAKTILLQTRMAKAEKLVIVPHGAPPVLREGKRLLSQKDLKCRVSKVLTELGDKRFLSTFGLISAGKGIEMVIAAMPKIVEKHPDVCYLVAGATHPEIVRKEGESYRSSLTKLVEQLDMQDHVRFIDAFLTPEELAMLLAKTSLYITPYCSRDQICSGALTFALAAGCPTVSTPYYYAVDVLKGGRGKLVPFDDPDALSHMVNSLLSDEPRLALMREQADKFGAQLPWPAVGASLFKLLKKLPSNKPSRWRQCSDKMLLPRIRMDHLVRMTKRGGGIVQFSRLEAPEYSSGYCIDDVTRQAIVAAWLQKFGLATEHIDGWLDFSLSMIAQAYDPDTTMMYNMANMKGRWLDTPSWGDHAGRTLWALGEVAGTHAVAEDLRVRASRLMEEIGASIINLPGLRPSAEAAVGLSRLPRRSAKQKELLRFVGNRLSLAYEQSSDTSWKWFEDRLTYDNARLPQGLILAGHILGDEKMLKQGLTTLDWLVAECGKLAPVWPYSGVGTIGNRWLSRERPATGAGSGKGDEQPLEFTALIETLVDAYKITGQPKYAREALKNFEWFLGANRQGKWLYDSFTGGSKDGLQGKKINPNMGAESTLAYYQALLSLAQADLIDIKTCS